MTTVIPTADTEHYDTMTGGLYALKGIIMDAAVKTDRLIERSLAATPKQTPPQGVPKLPLVLAVAGLAAACVSAGYPHPEARPVFAAHLTADAAREAMTHGLHAQALKYYLQIDNPTVPELFRTAECQFRTNDFDAALVTCCRIDFDTGGTSWSAPLVRGWIAERRGHKTLAYTWYMQAGERGSPDGKTCAARVK